MGSLIGASRLGMSHAWKSYCEHLVKRPLLTKILTGVAGTVVGDGIAQATAHLSARRAAAKRPGARAPRFQYNWARVTRLCLYAACIGTPIGHYWFAFLDKSVFPSRMGHPMTAILKMGLDQAIMAPAGLALFFTAISLMEGKSLQAAVEVVRDKFVPTMIANYMLWPAAQVVNFRFVPPEQRILYVNAIYIGWVSFLSTMAASDTGALKAQRAGAKGRAAVALDPTTYDAKTE